MEHLIFTAKGPSGERVTVEGGTFHALREGMGLCLVNLVSLVKPHDTVNPNFDHHRTLDKCDMHTK